MRCLYQCWFLKRFFGGKQLPVLPPWLHPVCDVAKANLLQLVNSKNEHRPSWQIRRGVWLIKVKHSKG